MLVLSKVYLVTKGALVPEWPHWACWTRPRPRRAGRGRSRRSRPQLPLNLGPNPGQGRARSHASVRDPGDPGRRPDDRRAQSKRTWPPSTPGSGCWPRCRASPSPCRPWPSSSSGMSAAVLWAAVAVFAAAAAAGARLPVPYRLGRPGARPRRGAKVAGRRLGAPVAAPAVESAPDRDPTWAEDDATWPLPADRRHRGDPGAHADVGAEGAGRVPHLPARLRSAPPGAATWWYGSILGA